MKQLAIGLLTLLLCLTAFPAVSAQEPARVVVSETVEYLEDGSTIVTTVYEDLNNTRSYIKKGSKTTKRTDSSGNVLWTFTVTGTFAVNEGVNAACTSATYSYTTPGSGWSLSSGSVSKSGNTATGRATFIKTVSGEIEKTDSTVCTLTCSLYGELS